MNIMHGASQNLHTSCAWHSALLAHHCSCLVRVLLPVFPGNLTDSRRSSPFAARLIATIPALKKEAGSYSKRRSYEERKYQILHTVISHVFAGFNKLHDYGADWKDAEGNVRWIKAFIANWLADGAERKMLTGFLKVMSAVDSLIILHSYEYCINVIFVSAMLLCAMWHVCLYYWQFNCSLCMTRHDKLDEILEEGDFPELRNLDDLKELRRVCLEEHTWPGCDDHPEFTNNGEVPRNITRMQTRLARLAQQQLMFNATCSVIGW